MSKYFPLVLSCKTSNWRMQDDDSETGDQEYQRVRPSVLQRDDHTCRFCGFKDAKGKNYIEVHHRDDDHHNNAPANLVTACHHCHSVFHIGRVGNTGEATLVYLPEIEQWQLSHLSRAILVAQHFPEYAKQTVTNPTKERLDEAKRAADAANALFARLKARETESVTQIGTCHPADLANAMEGLPTAEYEKRHERLAGIRLLMTGKFLRKSMDIMPTIVHGWLDRQNVSKGPFAGLHPPVWATLTASTAAARH